ncbi:TPA: ead/Ea22-like family protein [Klebsiella aerogenes]
MTTDITELAQSLKAAAEKASSGEWVKESGDGWEACCSANDQANGGFIIAHFEGPDAAENCEFVQAANPANIIALVEALEKAQHYIEELREWNTGLAQESCEREQRIFELENQLKTAENNEIDARCRIAELEESHAQAIQSRDHYKRMSEEGLKRLAESRTVTVKLPEPYGYLRENDGQIQISIGAERPSDRSGGYATPWFAIYTAAGVKVEAE